MSAQTEMWRRAGQQCDQIFGNALVLGDLNGDGYDDFATGVTSRPSCGNYTKEIWTWSGRDGVQIGQRWPLPFYNTEVGVRVLGDVDGDGTSDICGKLLGCYPNNCASIEAYSGRDRRLLWSVSGSWPEGWGDHFIGDIDVNGDCVPDLVVTAPGAYGNTGAVYAYDGRTGRLIYTSRRPSGWYGWGYSIAKYVDLDRDGAQDYLIAAITLGVDAVFVVSGRTGLPLRIGTGDPTVGSVAWSVSACGDIDGDGIADFAGGGQGGVMVFSGADGSVIHRLRPYAGDSRLGAVLRAGEDLDQDGIPDLVAGTWYEGMLPGRIYAFSGRDGSVLWSVGRSENYTTYLGTPESVSLLRPQPGNPFPLVVVEESGWGRTQCTCQPAGLFRVMRGSPPGVDAYGNACAAPARPTPRIGIRSEATLGPRVTISNGPAGGIALLMLGISRTQYAGVPLPIALDVIGLRGCLLQTSIELGLPISLGTTGINAGYATLRLPVTLAPPGPRTHNLYAQWLTLDTMTPVFTGVSQPLVLTTTF